jgi:hypothetical protein
VSFAEHIIQQEMWSGKMCFMSWSEFKEEFTLALYPENEATTALMQLKSDHYFQGKQNIEVYIDEFKDFVDLSGYTDPIAIVLIFCQGLNSTTQDRIAESGMDRLQDTDFNGWFKAAQCLDLNCLANEAFHYASEHPLTYPIPTPMMHSTPPCTLFSFFRSHPPPHRCDLCSKAHSFTCTSPWCSDGRQLHSDSQTCHANLLLLWSDWSHQQRMQPLS